jgi:hypothetical protein
LLLLLLLLIWRLSLIPAEYAKCQKPGRMVNMLKKAAKLFCLLDPEIMDREDSQVVMTSSAKLPVPASNHHDHHDEDDSVSGVTRQQQLLLSLIEGFLDANELYLFLEMCCWSTPLKDQFIELLGHREQLRNSRLPGTAHTAHAPHTQHTRTHAQALLTCAHCRCISGGTIAGCAGAEGGVLRLPLAAGLVAVGARRMRVGHHQARPQPMRLPHRYLPAAFPSLLLNSLCHHFTTSIISVCGVCGVCVCVSFQTEPSKCSLANDTTLVRKLSSGEHHM